MLSRRKIARTKFIIFEGRDFLYSLTIDNYFQNMILAECNAYINEKPI